MSNFQGVVFHRPVDLLAVGGRGEDGAEDASASLADLSRRCIFSTNMISDLILLVDDFYTSLMLTTPKKYGD